MTASCFSTTLRECCNCPLSDSPSLDHPDAIWAIFSQFSLKNRWSARLLCSQNQPTAANKHGRNPRFPGTFEQNPGDSRRIQVPLEKEYPLLAKAVAMVLFVVLCLVIPALLSMRPRQEIIAGSGSWASGDGHLKTPTLTFADVGGLEECKKQIRDLVQANLNGKKFGEYGVFRNGILLYGPRGTGKTFLAEAVAGEFKLKYCCVSAAGLHHRYVGETESHIDTLFQQAIANSPAVLFIDEIDALGTKRQQLGDGDDTGGAARGYNSATTRLMGVSTMLENIPV